MDFLQFDIESASFRSQQLHNKTARGLGNGNLT